MFSTRNSTLTLHFDGMFTRYSASRNHNNGDVHGDLVAFLSIVQKCNVDVLPITWQPALSNLGQGSTGTISQSTFNKEMPLAFKRLHEDEDANSRESEMDLLPLMSEVLILSQPPLQSHPNIVNLEGICWEIKPRTERAVPVLVFEKAAWDLQQFMNASEGINMSIDNRLKICAEIGSALMALHTYDVIHGDIKPQNVLVYKDITGKTTAKVADFGYSTLGAGEAGSVFLPKSRPWNAPEHHFGGFTTYDAKKTDVYSFGILCLWVLFGNTYIPLDRMERPTELVSFHASTGPQTSLEQLKYDDKVEVLANTLMESVSLADFNAEHRIRLKEFFSLTVTISPEKRTSDFGRLLYLLGRERAVLNPLTATQLEVASILSLHTDFRISNNLAEFVVADFRVRVQIKDALERNYSRNRNLPYAAHIAFQLAFCYRIGFGVKSDDTQCHIWLERSGRQSHDLMVEKEAVQPVRMNNKRIRKINQLVQVDLIQEYRTWGQDKMAESLKVYEREADDMAREFGELHFLPLDLYSVIGDILNELRQFAKSMTLRVRIRDRIEKTDRDSHPYYIYSILDVADLHQKQGEWMEAQVLYEKALKYIESRHGFQSLAITVKANLAALFWNQGRWKEAEQIHIQILETEKRALGQEHPTVMLRMGNLAFIYSSQGRWKEAVELEVQILETRKRIFGEEYLDTLASINNLACTYSAQGRWNEAEELFVVVMKTLKMVFGHEHPTTLMGISNLASTYRKLGRLKEAEELLVQVVDARKRVLGENHPDTLDSITYLASTFWDQGRWREAEHLEVQVMKTKKMVLGEDHPVALASMADLASTYKVLGRRKEAEALFLQVVEKRKRVLGEQHPDTLVSISFLASTYTDQKRWKEAEELEVQVIQTNTRVLGQEHPDTLASMGNLARTYMNQGKEKEPQAEELSVQAMETYKRVLGQEHPDTLTSMNNLASLYQNQGGLKEARAEMLFTQVIETRKRVLGQEHPYTLASMNNLASLYQSQRRWRESETLFLQVIEMFKKILGHEHPDTLVTMGNLVSTLRDQRRWKEAEELQNKVVEGVRTTFGEDHPSTVVAIKILASIRTHCVEPRKPSSMSLNELVKLTDSLLHFSASGLPECDTNTDTNEERLGHALVLPIDVGVINEIDEERPQCAQAMSSDDYQNDNKETGCCIA